MKFEAKHVSLALVAMLGLAANGCTKKNPAEQQAKVENEAAKDIQEERKEASQDIQENQKEIAEIKKETNEEVGEIRQDAAEEKREIAEDAREDGTTATTGAVNETKSTVHDNFKNRLDKLEDRVEAADDNLKKRKLENQASVSEALANAKAKYEAAKARVNEFDKADDKAWSGLKSGVEQSLAEAETAVKAGEDAIAAH